MSRSEKAARKVSDQTPVIVIGAGPAGLLAAYRAASLGVPVLVLEKMPSPGRKLLITGSGRCNLTNAVDLRSFIGQYFGQGNFLHPAFRHFFRPELIDLLQKQGIAVITENNGKIFPASGQAGDVLDALRRQAEMAGVRFRFNEAVQEICCPGGRVTAVRTLSALYPAEVVVLAAGGLSWPTTGSSGDGYRMAASVGHQLAPLRPALVPLVIDEQWVHDLSGISCPAVKAQLLKNGQLAGQSSGELLWTHFGLSGPAILRLSREMIPEPDARWQIQLDLRPDLKLDEIVHNLTGQIAARPKLLLRNVPDGLQILPRALFQALLSQCQIPPDQLAAQTSKRQIRQLAEMIKSMRLTISRTRGYREAMVTAGGVNLREVDPRTMGSRLVAGLFLAGEVLDLDGDTGGYNLQAAFSTGYLAGDSAAAAWLSRVDLPAGP